MNNRISSLVFATAISYLFLGCSQTNTSFSDRTPEATQDNQNINIKDHEGNDLHWLIYADPKADANLAIEKQDFTLLALTGGVTFFPGIENDSFTIQQQCGYRL